MRSVMIYLQPSDSKPLCKEVFEIFRKLDELFSPHLNGVQRCLSCRECEKTGQPGFFQLDNGIQLSVDNTRCSELDNHKLDAEVEEMMRKSFKLESLLDQIKVSDLKMFSESDIQQKMESGELKAGQQIWIFHSSETDFWNCMARVNPYAHVVVYVGSEDVTDKQGNTSKVHEVVHVSKSWKCCTLMKAEICRVDVNRVTLMHSICLFISLVFRSS